MPCGTPPASDEFDFFDKVEAFARRHRYFDLFTLALADKRLAEWRIVGNTAYLGIRFVLSHNLVSHRFVTLVEQSHRCPEHDPVTRKRLRIDNLGAAYAVFQLGDLRLDLTLAFLGGMIFGIFRQVAMGARLLDGVHDPRPFLPEMVELRGDLLVALREHGHFFHCSTYSVPSAAPARLKPSVPSQ